MEIDRGTHLERTRSLADRGGVMPPTGVEPETLPQPLARQPALMRSDWLPVGLFPEIDVLREQHQHHLDSVSEAGEKKRALQEGYEAEDNARAEALRLDNEVPAVTSSAERQDAINDAEAERVAALARFGDFIEQAAATFRSKEPEWRAEFARLTDDAEQKREAAKQMLAEADREVSRVSRLGLWLDRTIRPRAGRYESAPSLEPMESTPEAKLAAMAEV